MTRPHLCVSSHVMSCHAACLLLVFWCVCEVYSPPVMKSFDGPARLVGHGISEVLSPEVVIPRSSRREEATQVSEPDVI